jgi:hypothetical protein
MNPSKPSYKERRISMNARTHSPSRRKFLRALAAGAGCYSIGFPFVHPFEAEGQSNEHFLEQLSMPSRWAIAASGSVYNSVSFSKYRYDKEGQKKYNEDAKKRNQEAGAEMLKFAFGHTWTGHDPKSMAAILPAVITLFNGPQQKYEIEEATTEKARVKCTHCAIWYAMEEMKITEDLCSMGCQFMWKGFSEAMNPKMTSTLVKIKPQGASVCEWVIELKA